MEEKGEQVEALDSGLLQLKVCDDTVYFLCE